MNSSEISVNVILESDNTEQTVILLNIIQNEQNIMNQSLSALSDNSNEDVKNFNDDMTSDTDFMSQFSLKDLWNNLFSMYSSSYLVSSYFVL